jgi:hypothetical protein
MHPTTRAHLRQKRRSRTPGRRVFALVVRLVRRLRDHHSRRQSPAKTPRPNQQNHRPPADGTGHVFRLVSLRLLRWPVSPFPYAPSLHYRRFTRLPFLRLSRRTVSPLCSETVTFRCPPFRSSAPVNSLPACLHSAALRFHFAVAKIRLKQPLPLHRLGDRASPISAS